MNDQDNLDPGSAAALIAETDTRARRSLTVRLPLLYAAWGTSWLLGLGAMWLSVRQQDPYRGPGVLSAIVLAVLIAVAIMVTMVTVLRASSGIGGGSAIRGRMYGLAWPIGFAAWFAVLGAVGQHGASDEVMGLLGATGPLLMTSLIYMVGAAIWLEWSMFVLGAWLAVVTAVGVSTDPATALLIGAVAGGGGFLAAAAALSRRRN